MKLYGIFFIFGTSKLFENYDSQMLNESNIGIKAINWCTKKDATMSAKYCGGNVWSAVGASLPAEYMFARWKLMGVTSELKPKMVFNDDDKETWNDNAIELVSSINRLDIFWNMY